MNQEVYVTNQSVIKVTEDVVFINRYRSYLWGGQYSTYQGTIIGLIGFYFFGIFGYYISFLKGTPPWIEIMLFLSLFILPFYIWMIILWRLQLPICFNKKTQKVSTWIGGELAEIEWERFHMFQTKIQDGAQSTVEVFLFTLFGKSGKRYPRTMWDKGNPSGLYHLIHNFMNHKEPIIIDEGKMQIARGNFQLTYIELFKLRFSFSKEEGISSRIWLIFTAIFFTVPIDFLMYGLNKILPRRKMPKELLEACGCSKDERVYG